MADKKNFSIWPAACNKSRTFGTITGATVFFDNTPRRSRLRAAGRLIHASANIGESAYDLGTEAAELMSQAEKQIFEIADLGARRRSARRQSRFNSPRTLPLIVRCRRCSSVSSEAASSSPSVCLSRLAQRLDQYGEDLAALRHDLRLTADSLGNQTNVIASTAARNLVNWPELAGSSFHWLTGKDKLVWDRWTRFSPFPLPQFRLEKATNEELVALIEYPVFFIC